LNGSNNVTSL